MPEWVNLGFADYAKRLGKSLRFELIEVEAPRRGTKMDVARLVQEEGARLLQAVPKGCYQIALDETGRSYDSVSLAQELAAWKQRGQDVALLVGGPEGLSSEVLSAVDAHWSLSTLTLAHPLVRVMVAEQLYRAHAILEGLPYHRSGRVA